MRLLRIGLAALAGAAAAQPSFANDLFQINVSITTPTVSSGEASASTITGLVNELKTANLTALTGAYTDQSAATASLNIRGLSATTTYVANSTTLRLIVPAAGVDTSFTGATRDDSQNQLKDFLLKNGGGLATKILQALVGSSPIDPVAGNPASSQNTMARSDFGIATGIGLGGAEIPGQGQARGGLVGQPNLISLGGEVGFISSGGYSGTSFTLPIRYTIPFSDERYAVTIDVPISYVEFAGSASYFGSAGVSLRVPVTDNWYITPAVRGGASGSVDLGAAAIEYSGSVASRYDLFFGGLGLTVGNALTVAKTAPLSVGSVNVSYNLTNELITNGVQAEDSLPWTLFGEPTSWQAYVADTFVEGSKVYVSHYDEFGATIGTRHAPNTQDWQSLRLGVGFTVGEHYNAAKLGFLYRF